MTFAEALSDARAALAENQLGQALDALRTVFENTATLSTPEEFASGLDALDRVFGGLGYELLARRAREAATLAPDALRQFGSTLIAQRMPAFAAGVLDRAHAVAPERADILEDLVAALELTGRYAEARSYLERHGGKSFLLRYLLAFETLMAGDVSEARRLAAALKPRGTTETHLRERLRGIFARHDVARSVSRLPPSDRRAWHFVLTGGLLLRSQTVDALEDSDALCAEGIHRLSAVLQAWGVDVPRVLAFENPESRRFGLACGELLGVPVESVFVPEGQGLFVAYDLGYVIPEVLAALRPIRPGLTIFSHAAQTTVEQPLAADFTTVLYGSLVTPWNRPHLLSLPHEVSPGTSTTSDEELAHRIARARLPDGALDDLPELVALATAAKSTAAGARSSGERERQWVGA